MKLKDFFLTKAKQGKINNEDANKIFETLPDTDLPDVFVNLFDDAFLTRERALSDGKVIDKIRSEVLDGVDANLKEIYPFLDTKDQNDISAESKTFTKLKMLKPALERTVEKLKTTNPSNDEQVKELQRVNQEYVQKLTAQKSEFESKEKEIRKTFDFEKQVMKLDWTLDKKVGEYTFADEFKEVRPHLTKAIIDKIKGENVLILGEDGQIQIHEKLESGATKQKFNGNDAVTLENLLEPQVKPYLKKNNNPQNQNGGGQGVSQNGNGGQGRTQTTPGNGKTPQQMTLAELRAAGIKLQ